MGHLPWLSVDYLPSNSLLKVTEPHSGVPGQPILNIVLAVDPGTKLEAANLDINYNSRQSPGLGWGGYLDTPGKVKVIRCTCWLGVDCYGIYNMTSMVQHSHLHMLWTRWSWWGSCSPAWTWTSPPGCCEGWPARVCSHIIVSSISGSPLESTLWRREGEQTPRPHNLQGSRCTWQSVIIKWFFWQKL